MMKKLFLLIAVSFLVFVAGCTSGSEEKTGSNPAGVTINVSAAVSLKDVLNELKDMFEKENNGIKLSFNFASSGTLQQQIEQGAPVDLFISAGQKQMDALLDKGLADNPVNIARNELVLVVPEDRHRALEGLAGLTRPEYEKIAIGVPETVPAGKYARETLEKAGFWQEVLPKLVLAKDVRQVLYYVETGNVDAGFVYRTDTLKSKKVKVEISIPEGYHSPVTYPAAVIKSSPGVDQAESFLQFLQTKEAREVFKKYGFH